MAEKSVRGEKASGAVEQDNGEEKEIPERECRGKGRPDFPIRFPCITGMKV